MESVKVVIGRLVKNRITFKPMIISKGNGWIKWLDSEELAEFTAELLTLADQIAKGKKNSGDIELFLSEWRETALVNQESDVLDDIIEAESELDSNGGKEWAVLKKEIGL